VHAIFSFPTDKDLAKELNAIQQHPKQLHKEEEEDMSLFLPSIEIRLSPFQTQHLS
jgi:hypothetical protein